MKEVKIVLVDDHKVIRKGLQLLFNSEPTFKVVGEFDAGSDALEFLKENEVDVLISDITMPEMNGIELVEKVTESYPLIGSMLLTMHIDEKYILDGLEAGAKAYVVKDSSESEIIEAVHCVCKNETYITKKVANVLAKRVVTSRQISKKKERASLTNREKEILKLIVGGSSNKMIGAELFISDRTVNVHRYNIMKKLDAKNSADLVRIAITDGLVG